MDIHYNAFISYRHHPDDIRVASQIHRLLEHYRVPRAIRRKSKGITRLFRDKEELPITSNLSDDITRALENSEFLIVICSTHTRESSWVRREIETFLKSHDRNRILTVLVDGEPYDTIPEILLYEEKTDPETGKTVRAEFEPLSCDWRMPLRQARREELPRLAAALLGCGYDELRQRERQYRTRRLVAGFSVALAATLCFAAYVMHNNMRIQDANHQLESANTQLANANTQLENANTNLENANAEIQANYLKALENQSQYLASAAETLLEDGDRLTAMLLALEALPEYEGERPYVAAAEYALGTAVGIYSPNTAIMASGGFACDGLVTDFKVTKDGKTIYILDARDVLTVWDTNTYERRATTPLDMTPQEILVTGEGNLLILDILGDRLVCFNPDGQTLWEVTENYLYDIAFLDGMETLMVSLFMEDAYAIRFLNPATGEDVREPLYPEVAEIPYFLRDHNSSDGPLALHTYSLEGSTAWMLNLDTGMVTQLITDQYAVRLSGLTVDGNVLILTQQEQAPGGQGTFMEYLLTSPAEMKVICFSGKNGRRLWETAFSSCFYSSYCTLETIPQGTDILCQTGNCFVLLDSTTGEIKAKSESPSYVMWSQVREEYTLAVLEDGSIGQFTYADSSCTFKHYTKSDLTRVDVGDAYYVLDSLNTQVTAYRSIGDENWAPIAENMGYPNEWHMNGDCTVLELYSAVQLYDAGQGTLRWEQPVRRAEVLGFSRDNSTLWVTGEYGELLAAIDMETGEMTQWELPNAVQWISPYTGKEGETSTSPVSNAECMWEDDIIYLTREYFYKQIYLFRYDTATETAEYWPLYACDENYSGYDDGRILAATGEYALVWDMTRNTVLEFCFDTGESRTVAENILYRPAAFLSEGGDRYLLGTGTAIQRRSWMADADLEILLDGIRAVSLCVREDKILAVGDNGNLYCFDEAGNPVAETELNIYNSFAGGVTSSSFDPSQISWSFAEDGSLVLGVLRMGNVIDCGTWQKRAYIPNCYGYLPGQNAVLVLNGNQSGTFPLYSMEDVVAMAREALNGCTMAEEQRAKYGLD